MSYAEYLADAKQLARIEGDYLDAQRRAYGTRWSSWIGRRRTPSRTSRFSRARGLSLHLLLLVGVLWNTEGFVEVTTTEGPWYWAQIFVICLLSVGWLPNDELTEATDFDRLRMPSFQSMVLYRWLKVLPDNLVIGACWATIVLKPGWNGSVDAAGWIFGAALLLAPLYLSTQWHARARLEERATPPLLFVILALSFVPSIVMAIHLPWLGGPPHLAVATLLLAWVAIGTPLSLHYTLRGTFTTDDDWEYEHTAPFEVTEQDVATPTGLHRPRSLLASSWFLQWCTLRPRLRALWTGVGPFSTVVFGLLGGLITIGIGAGAIWNADDGPSLAISLIAILACVGSTDGGASHGWYFLGVDLREQVRHDIRSKFLFGLAPTLVLANLLWLLVEPTPSRDATLGLLAGFGLWRLGWSGWFRGDTARALGVGAILVVGLFVTALFGISTDVAWILAGVTAVIGLIGIAAILLTSEATLRAAMRAAEE